MKVKILCLLLAISLTIISCSGKTNKTFTSRKSSESLSLVSEERDFLMDVFLLLDQSGSMNGTRLYHEEQKKLI